MVETSRALAEVLSAGGLPMFRTAEGITTTHQFAVDGSRWGGGHAAALRLRDANVLTCAIGLPGGDEWSGLRFGTPEIVRWGMEPSDMPELGGLIIEALDGDPHDVAPAVTKLRSRFTELHYLNP